MRVSYLLDLDTSARARVSPPLPFVTLPPTRLTLDSHLAPLPLYSTRTFSLGCLYDRLDLCVQPRRASLLDSADTRYCPDPVARSRRWRPRRSSLTVGESYAYGIPVQGTSFSFPFCSISFLGADSRTVRARSAVRLSCSLASASLPAVCRRCSSQRLFYIVLARRSLARARRVPFEHALFVPTCPPALPSFLAHLYHGSAMLGLLGYRPAARRRTRRFSLPLARASVCSYATGVILPGSAYRSCRPRRPDCLLCA